MHWTARALHPHRHRVQPMGSQVALLSTSPCGAMCRAHAHTHTSTAHATVLPTLQYSTWRCIRHSTRAPPSPTLCRPLHLTTAPTDAVPDRSVSCQIRRLHTTGTPARVRGGRRPSPACLPHACTLPSQRCLPLRGGVAVRLALRRIRDVGAGRGAWGRAGGRAGV